jgi:tetratricopeptide (TPR) repeat protein
VGGGTRQEQLALGETPNLAARLQGIAAPNTLVISATTFQLLGGFFACQPLGTPPLKGQAQPLAVYRVLYESMARSRLEAVGTTGLTPLVGREQEIGLLQERWMQVKDGLGQVVLLSGEAGIGKSRLVQVLKEHVASDPQAWLTPCQCSPYYQNTALYPMIELLERVALRFEWEESPPQKLSKLEGFVVQYGLPLAETVPLLATLLSLPLTADYGPLTMESEQQKHKTLHALLMILLRIAAQQPVLFVMEDLHWVDPTTLEFLSLLVDQGPTARILALFTFRPDFSPPWTGRAHLTQVTVHRLLSAQAVEVIHHVAHGKALPPEVIAQIVAKTDGVPLFVEELTKMVLESGLLQEREECYALTGPLPSLAIPTTLHDSLMARLDRLAMVKSLAQLGATLGREFSYALLQAVSPWDEETLQRGLHQLVEAEFLYQRGMPPQATYIFKHALVQDAAYQSLLRSTRQQYHQRILQILEAQFPETAATTPELLAYHAQHGERWDQAVTYFRQAGEQAVARSAYREAVAAFEQVLVAMQHLPESREALEQAIDLRLALRSALYPLGEPGKILICLQEAQALAEALGDSRRLGGVAAHLLAHFVQMCEPDRALASGQRALAIATTLGDVGLTVVTQYLLGGLYRSLGAYRQAIELLQQCVARLDSELLHERFGLPGLVSVQSRSFLVTCLAECGAFTEGSVPAEEGVRIAEAANHPYTRTHIYWSVGFQALRQGNLFHAIPTLERALALAQEAHLRLWGLIVAAPLGAAYTLAGRTTEALLLLEQTVAQAVAIGYMWDHALWVVWLSEAYLLAGRLAEASTQAQYAFEFSRAHQARGHEAYALRLLGEIAARREPSEGELAVAHYQQAITLAEALGMRPLQAHCHRGLGTQYATIGQQEQARVELSTAIEMYQSMEMTFWLPETQAALAQVEGR